MDKQKQIEESKSCYSCNHYYACEDCYKAFTRSNDYFKKHIAHNREIAMHCKCYQPKIPEGAVIVSKQVWEEHIENWDKTTKAVEERVRKETAEKFAEKLFETFDEYFMCDKAFIERKIVETCKEFTEGEYGESLCEE